MSFESMIAVGTIIFALLLIGFIAVDYYLNKKNDALHAVRETGVKG